MPPNSSTHSSKSFLFEPHLTHVERLLFTKYLSVLLRSGLPIDESLDILLQQSKGSLQKILTTLKSSVRMGKTLSDGLQQFPRTFSPVYLNLIRAGESSGTLQGNLDQIAIQLQKEHDLSQKIRGAMMYPMIILIVGLMITIGIVVFVLPNIIGIFDSLHVELPLSTRIVLWVSRTTQAHGVAILIGLMGFVVGMSFLLRMSKVKPVSHWILLRIPIFGLIIRQTNLARVTRLMGILLQSGLPISEALDISRSVLRNVYYIRLFQSIKDGIGRGSTMTTMLESSSFLVPSLALRLIRVGEETGTLGEMFLYLAGFYEQEVDDLTRNLSSLLEPALIMFIGFMVGGLALSILTPIYKVVSSV